MDREPWERQENEGPEAFEAFALYRDMGIERSVRKVARQLNKSSTLIGRWSSTHGWQNRVKEWDNEQDRIAREEQIKTIREMRKRQRNIALKMQQKGLALLESISHLGDIRMSEVVSLLKNGMEQERIANGDAGEVIEQRDGGQAPSAVQFYMPDNGRDKKDEEQSF